MAGEQFQLDLPSVIKSQFGDGTVSSVNSDGSATIQVAGKDGNTQAVKFDPISYSKANGIDPTKVKVQYNTPETALNDNPIGFRDGLGMALSDSKGQEEFLQGKYGKDSVQKTKDGQFLVNDNGAWKKADPGFLAKMASNLPEMAAYGPGEIAGGAIGGVIAGPIGAGVGALAGGALAASLAKVVKEKGVEALGLRSEQDAGEAAKEFGHDVVNNLIWGTVGKVVVGAGKLAVGAASGAINKVMGSVDKEGLSAMAEKLLPGTSKTDWSAVVRSPEDAKAVQDGLQQMADYGTKAASSVVKGMDPMTQKMTSTVKGFMGDAKDAAESQYGTMLKDLEESGLHKVPVQVADSATKLKSSMIGMGLLEKDVESGSLRFNPSPKSEDAERILQVFDAKSRNTIRQVFDQVTNVAKDGGEIPFAKARMLIGGVDDILENSGFYKNGDSALSNNVRRALSEFRQGLSDNLSDGLKGQVAMKDGVAVDALNYFKDANSKYSQFRSVMNDFSMSKNFGGDLRQQAVTVEKMLGDKGYGLEDSFMKLGSAVGKDSEPVLQSLQQMRAAKNLSDVYTPAKGVLSLTREALTGGPRAWANRAAQATQSADAYSKQWNESLMSKIPAKVGSKALVDARARMADFVNGIGAEGRLKLITNPVALRSMVDAVESTPQLQQTATGQMLQPIQQMMNGNQGQNGQ